MPLVRKLLREVIHDFKILKISGPDYNSPPCRELKAFLGDLVSCFDFNKFYLLLNILANSIESISNCFKSFLNLLSSSRFLG